MKEAITFFAVKNEELSRDPDYKYLIGEANLFANGFGITTGVSYDDKWYFLAKEKNEQIVYNSLDYMVGIRDVFLYPPEDGKFSSKLENIFSEKDIKKFLVLFNLKESNTDNIYSLSSGGKYKCDLFKNCTF